MNGRSGTMMRASPRRSRTWVIARSLSRRRTCLRSAVGTQRCPAAEVNLRRAAVPPRACSTSSGSACLPSPVWDGARSTALMAGQCRGGGRHRSPDRPGPAGRCRWRPRPPTPRSADDRRPGIRPAGRAPVAYRDYSTKHSCQCHHKNLASAPCSEDGRHISAGDAILPGRAWWREPTRSEGVRVSLPSSRDLLDYARRCKRRSGQAGRSQ